MVRVLLRSHIARVRAFCFRHRVCLLSVVCLSVPLQISKTKQDRRQISSLW